VTRRCFTLRERDGVLQAETTAFGPGVFVRFVSEPCPDFALGSRGSLGIGAGAVGAHCRSNGCGGAEAIRRCLRVVGDMAPCRADPCPVYDPKATYRYALEVNRGAFPRWKVHVGDRITVRRSR
jgi:hypothetical protein